MTPQPSTETLWMLGVVGVMTWAGS
jgi:hypothetical protein